MGIGDLLKDHPAISAGIGGAVIGAGAVAIAGAVRRRRKKVKRAPRRKTTRKKVRKKSTRKTAKRRTKKQSRKKIRFTKNGQPFIILPSGKARFISKKSARIRKKRRGGFF